MGNRFAEIAFTPSVQARQRAHGSRASYERISAGPARNDRFGDDEIEFVHARDGFYLASTSETGWPYLQYRGGPRGFLRALDDRTLGRAELREVGADDGLAARLAGCESRGAGRPPARAGGACAARRATQGAA